ncbi:major facilitator superfamily domain-containing protein [Aspergillus caelatus]|uniref:Major facilitator superfamily domain-containing protein n=1 Tax=Aspergillus caelatus TaxID=61420 RepID=A0A5N6ZNZ9_9EURO|nr:major facilitator superfamily domain-containing protein [Aspergillus caelatus]KAE8359337.1 major facilitator superfamily domain-containing protein [Aspergillus caelatus]
MILMITRFPFFSRVSLEDQSAEEKGPKNSALIIFCISCITFISCYLGGLVTVSVPAISKDLALDPGIELWPVSMYALATGCTLLILGAVSDAVGSRIIFLIGCFLQSIFCMACGLSATGTQLILFRVVSGLATSLCLPSAMSLISEHFPAGKLRNLAFAFMGGGQPVGFGVGILCGGIIADSAGWRWGFYSAAIANTFAFLLSWWQIPRRLVGTVAWHMLVFGIDWVGAVAASAALGLLSYALSLITGDIKKAHEAPTIACFSLSGALLIFFVLWQSFQDRRNKPTLIRNSLWKNMAFTCICINVFMIWGAFNAFEQVINFFFQNVQHLSGIETAIRFIPTPITGLLSALVTGLVLHRCRADAIINITTIISCVSPLIMALVDPAWVYWRCAFVAICLNSIAADSLFTVSNILIAGVFPAETQGLAAGVFNTVSQIGKSFGLAIVALISNQITGQQSQFDDKGSPEALMVGYRAAFWTLFGMNIASLVVSLFGLRKVGNIGKKKTQ